MPRANHTLVLLFAVLATAALPACTCGGPIESPMLHLDKLQFTAQPSNAAVGATITPPVAVSATDSSNNVLSSFTSAITLALDGGTAGATLSGTLTVTALNGVATFSDLKVNQPGSYTLSATSSGILGNFTSASFNVTTGTHAISGTVSGAVSSGVAIGLSGAGTGTTTTGANGAYNFGGLADGSYTLTPLLAGYTFAPVYRAVTLSGADVTGQDFAASHPGATTHIYLTDAVSKTVVRMDDLSGTNFTVLKDAGTESFLNPWGIVVDGAENLYVADRTRIVQTTITGAPWTVVSHNAANTDQFVGLEGIALDATGKLYVTDWGGTTARVVETEMTGTTWNTLGGTMGSGTLQFGCPGMIFVDSSGTPPVLYIADRCNNRIVQTTMSGTPWNVLSDAGTDGFRSPRGIFVEDGGVLWVADEGNSRVVRTTMSGTPWTTEKPAPLPDGGPAWPPTALWVDSAGLVYVVSYFGPDFLEQLTPPSTWAEFVAGPSGQNFSSSYGVCVR